LLSNLISGIAARDFGPFFAEREIAFGSARFSSPFVARQSLKEAEFSDTFWPTRTSKRCGESIRLILTVFLGGAMKAEQRETRIVLQVGSELKIKDNGDIVIDNPELELDREDGAADAVLLYRFDLGSKEHILRLVDPVADHEHIKQHRRND
jgi:hypothetical protein